jgi:hypothetical protein
MYDIPQLTVIFSLLIFISRLKVKIKFILNVINQLKILPF